MNGSVVGPRSRTALRTKEKTPGPPAQRIEGFGQAGPFSHEKQVSYAKDAWPEFPVKHPLRPRPGSRTVSYDVPRTTPGLLHHDAAVLGVGASQAIEESGEVRLAYPVPVLDVEQEGLKRKRSSWRECFG